eukprot:3850067-Amphidinium_carterae.1
MLDPRPPHPDTATKRQDGSDNRRGVPCIESLIVERHSLLCCQRFLLGGFIRWVKYFTKPRH